MTDAQENLKARLRDATTTADQVESALKFTTGFIAFGIGMAAALAATGKVVEKIRGE